MYTITKEFTACCSHQLTGLPDTHPCSNFHGHNYTIKVELKSEKLDSVGFVKDYRALDGIKEYIDTVMDHKHLNSVFDFNPTSENLAFHLFQRFSSLLFDSAYLLNAVEVYETPKTKARYERSDY